MTMVKGLVQDGRFSYAFSGSMLGTELKHVRSYPVGFVTEVTMFPMDFEEFCWATGVQNEALSVVRDCCTSLQAVRLPARSPTRLLPQLHGSRGNACSSASLSRQRRQYGTGARGSG